MKIVIVLFAVLLFKPLFAFSYCKNIKSKNHDYSTLLNKVNSLQEEISHQLPIQSESRGIFKKLIKEKSPFIKRWMKKRGLNFDKKQEGVFHKWERYYFDHFFVNRYLKRKKEDHPLIEDLFLKVLKLSFTQKEKIRIEKSFDAAKEMSLQYIEGIKLEKKQREVIKRRISQVKIYWPKKLKGSKFEKAPLEFLKWGVAYDPVPNEVNIGIEARAYSSRETLVAVFIHEIAHSIDPCRWSAFIGTKNPFEHVVSCLRKEEGAGAKRRDDSLMESLLKKGKLNSSLVDSLKVNPTCNSSLYPVFGLQKDQSLEAFADWFSAEVLSQSPKYIVSHLRSDLCEAKTLKKGSSYIPNEKRLKSIYLAHPKIKDKLSPKNKSLYCSF